MIDLKRIKPFIRHPLQLFTFDNKLTSPEINLNSTYKSLISKKGHIEFAAWMANKIKKNARCLVLIGSEKELLNAKILNSKSKSQNKLEYINSENNISGFQKQLLSIDFESAYFLFLLNEENFEKIKIFLKRVQCKTEQLNKQFRNCATLISTLDINDTELQQETHDARVIFAEPVISNSSVLFPYSSLLSILFVAQSDVFQTSKEYSNFIANPKNTNELKTLTTFFNHVLSYLKKKRLSLDSPSQNQYDFCVHTIHSMFSQDSGNDYFAYAPNSNKKYYLEVKEYTENSCKLIFKVQNGTYIKILHKSKNIDMDFKSELQVGIFFYSLESSIHAAALKHNFSSL